MVVFLGIRPGQVPDEPQPEGLDPFRDWKAACSAQNILICSVSGVQDPKDFPQTCDGETGVMEFGRYRTGLCSWCGFAAELLMLNIGMCVIVFTLYCGRYCGTQGPPSMTSTNNVMSVMFASDRSVTSQGFSAVYTTINATSSNVIVKLIHPFPNARLVL